MGASVTFLDFGCAVFALYLARRFLTVKNIPQSLPPGPPGLPVVKNLFNWPSTNECETFAEWGRIYGDIVYANVAGAHMIVLNTYEAAMSMLNRKGTIYSDRPSLYFVAEMIGWKESTTLSNQGPRWKEHRRMFAQQLGSQGAVERFTPMLESRTREFIRQVMDDPSPEMLLRHIRTLAGAIILDVTFGYEVKGKHDDLVDLAEAVVDDFSTGGQPGTHLVDAFPFLARLPSWLPGTGFQREAADKRARLMRFIETPYQFTRDQIAAEIARPSLVASTLEARGELSYEQERILKWTATTMYAAGADTTVSVIYSFFLFMTLYPDILAKAQAEIDTVIGLTRLPMLSDRTQLPYINAIILEVYRHGQVIPRSIPHKLREDDVHEGYFIPKDSTVIANLWGMARDSRQYRNPDAFDPSRFMGDKPELDPRSYVFGFGRRICPGRLFGDENVFLTCATALATLNFAKATDIAGQEITPVVEFYGGLIAHAKYFPCVLTPRSGHAETLAGFNADN